MTTERLFEFLVLSQTLNFTSAARKLFMTQSALSRHIAELENEMGIKVLERNTHSVKLTQSGRMLASRIPRLLQSSDLAMANLRYAESQASGSVYIACLENSVNDQLLKFLIYFGSKFPEINLEVDVLSRTDRLAVIDSYDVTVTDFELQKLPSYVNSYSAFSIPAVLSYAEAHRSSTKTQMGLEELAGETLIVPFADDLFCSYATNRQLAEKLCGYNLNIIKANSPESAIAMTALGKGVAIMPQHLSTNPQINVWSVDISTAECVFTRYMYFNTSCENKAASILEIEFQNYTRSLQDK